MTYFGKPYVPPRQWRYRIDDVLRAVERIRRYTSESTELDFANDDKTLDAVIRNFEVIGEALRHIPVDVESKHPHIPWRQLRDMRNVLIHRYFEVLPELVWRAIHDDLPHLEAAMRSVRADESNQDEP